MIYPSITNKQKQIIFLFYKFRFLTINQLLKILNHKDPHRIKEWLTDLIDKKYITLANIVNKKDITKPYIYCLNTKAKYIFKENEEWDELFLGRLYKEKSLTETFISHCLFIADIYLFFLTRKTPDSKLHFFTQHELKDYDNFPEESPDAYIAVETEEGTDRYFLELYDKYREPAFLPRNRIKEYVTFCEDATWQDNTNSPFPSILFVLAHDKRKKHIFHYGKSLLEKTFEDISLFLATMDAIKFSSKDTNIWQKAVTG
jgi:hypothetical protein